MSMFTLAISFNGPCRSVAETSYPSPKYWGSDGEEQPHIQGQGRWPSGTTTHLKSGEAAERSNPIAKSRGCAGAGGPKGPTPRPKLEGGAMRRYPYPRKRAAAGLCWSSREEISHIQGKRNPSKMVGAARGHQKADTLKP